MTLFLFSLACLWGCRSLDHDEPADLPPDDASEFEAYLGPTFLLGCTGVQERFWIERGGALTWISEHRAGSWERVTGTWTLEPGAMLSHTLKVEGVRTSYRSGAPHPLAEPWNGTVHLTPLAAVPAVAFQEEARDWDHPCLEENPDIAAVWTRGQSEDALTLTGSLEGVFEPG